MRLHSSCDEDFEFNIFFDNLWRANVGSVVPSLVSVLVVGELLLWLRTDKVRVTLACLAAALAMAIMLGLVHEETHVIWLGGMLQGFVYAALAALAMLVIETYTTSQRFAQSHEHGLGNDIITAFVGDFCRSSALGLFMCGGHAGALCGALAYAMLPLTSTAYASILTSVALLTPAAVTFFMPDLGTQI